MVAKAGGFAIAMGQQRGHFNKSKLPPECPTPVGTWHCHVRQCHVRQCQRPAHDISANANVVPMILKIRRPARALIQRRTWRFTDMAIHGYGDSRIWRCTDMAMHGYGDARIWRCTDMAMHGHGDAMSLRNLPTPRHPSNCIAYGGMHLSADMAMPCPYVATNAYTTELIALRAKG